MTSIMRIAPNICPADELAKPIDALVCPFCGQGFEPIDVALCDRKAKCECTPEDKQGFYMRTIKEQIPIALRCVGCGIEIRNIQFLGLHVGIEKYKTSLERQQEL